MIFLVRILVNALALAAAVFLLPGVTISGSDSLAASIGDTPATLVAYMAEKDCDYLLIDRADDYLEREFSPLFEGGLTADMPATLYHFEGEDAAVPFTVAAVAESEVA